MKRDLVNPYARKKLKTTTAGNTATVTTTATTSSAITYGSSSSSSTTTPTPIIPKPFDLFESIDTDHAEKYSIATISNSTTTCRRKDETPGTDIAAPPSKGGPFTTTTTMKSLSNNLSTWQRPSVAQSLSFGSAEIMTLPQACQVQRDVHRRSIRVTGVVLYRCSCCVAATTRQTPPGKEEEIEEEATKNVKVHLVLGDPVAPLRTSSILKESSVKMASTTPANASGTAAASTPIASVDDRKTTTTTTTSSVLFDKSKTKKIVFRKKTTERRRLSFAVKGSLSTINPAVQLQDVLNANTTNRLWVIAPAGTILNVQDTVTILGETQWDEEVGKMCLVARIVRKTNGMHMKLYHDALVTRQNAIIDPKSETTTTTTTE